MKAVFFQKTQSNVSAPTTVNEEGGVAPLFELFFFFFFFFFSQSRGQPGIKQLFKKLAFLNIFF